jgi:hypothetical protein
MKVYIDSKPLDIDTSKFNNLEDLIYEVMSNHTAGDKLITEVKVNDVTFSERWPGEAKIIPIDKIVRIDFITSSIEIIASKMLEDIPAQVESITKGLLEAAELYRVADEQEANLNFIKIVTSLRDFVNFVTQLKNADVVPWEKLEIKGMDIETYYTRLIKLIDEMLDVQEDEDWILLADLIEYELAPIMNKWKEFLMEAKKEINEK